MKNKHFANLIYSNSTIRETMERFNTFTNKDVPVVLVIDENEIVLGTITDGDIRRALVKGIDIDSSILDIMNKNFQYIESVNDYVKLKTLKNLNYRLIPHLDADKKIIDLIDLTEIKAILPLDVVIMAGGKGTRLQPYTNTCPKPMLELNGKPIIAYNIDRLLKFGVKNFYISVNYLKEQIINYITINYEKTNAKFHFIEESEPLGTIGSLSLVEKFSNNNILVMNADILTNIDFEDFYLYYKDQESAMLTATFNVKIDIPYGVLETEEKQIKSLVEKPSYTYYSNAGIYLIKKEYINKIPKNAPYNSTDFMELLIDEKLKVCHFPIRGYWLDIGNIANYSKAKDDVMYINF